MTDRELLEFAAKAAGFEIVRHRQAARDAAGYGDVGLYIKGLSTCWNPLTDSGQALELAVKLGIAVQCHASSGCGYALTQTGQNEDQAFAVAIEPGDDPYAATRRAIVRAAAEIGRVMP